MKIEQAIETMGLILPEARQRPGAFVSAVREGNLVFVSGHTGMQLYEFRGKLGRDLTTEQGYEAARCAILGALAALKREIGDLDRVKRIVKLLSFVNAVEDFPDCPAVTNGATDLLNQLFGEDAKHARSTIGVSSLMENAPVEIEMVVALRE